LTVVQVAQAQAETETLAGFPAQQARARLAKVMQVALRPVVITAAAAVVRALLEHLRDFLLAVAEMDFCQLSTEHLQITEAVGAVVATETPLVVVAVLVVAAWVRLVMSTLPAVELTD
jgi:hypothetical protein